MPREAVFGYVSKYVSEEEHLADELDYRDLAPPLLAAGVRNRALRRLLRLSPNDIVLDNGCGTAKFAAWNADQVKLMIGCDPATLFADAAVEQVALVKGDSRVLPFADNTIDKAISIDVLEHFPRDVIATYLSETARVLRPGGQMLIFSNTRERSPIQPLIDISRRLGRIFVKAGLYDFEREARRKSDHIKALETWEEVQAAVAEAGLRQAKVVFWNSLFTTFVEHIVMKLGETVLGRITKPKTPPSDNSVNSVVNTNDTNDIPPSTNDKSDTSNDTGDSHGDVHIGEREIRARQRVRRHIGQKGVFYTLLFAITLLMELDLWLFGWMRCGSYFLVVEKP